MTDSDSSATDNGGGVGASADNPSPSAAAGTPRINLAVFLPTIAIAAALLVWGFAFTESFESSATNAFNWVVDSVGWVFVIVATAVVGYVIYLVFTKYGKLKLGGDDEEPQFSTLSWIAMMFAAGMGIGLMFFGVAEPLGHYMSPPPGDEALFSQAMATTLFHWTLHPWAIYAVVGLALALSAFRYKRGHLISQAFVPIIGERHAKGAVGIILDVATILATVFGTAASLGLGALQIQTGLQETGAIDAGGVGIVIGVIIVLGLVFLVSAASGVSVGIKWLSNINLIMAGLLALFLLVFSGAIVFILDLIPTAVGAYVAGFVDMASRTAVSENGEAAEWLAGWTVFYWAWWISWSPFVGMFLARISRGRSVRQFLVGVVAVPSALSLVWFAIFGGFGLERQSSGVDIYGDGTSEPMLFALLGQVPLTGFLSVIAMIVIALFFVTSADSASVVMGGMAQYGAENPARWVTMLMGSLTALVAIVMLLAGGDEALTALQNITIIAASPFVFVLAAMCVAIQKSVAQDPTIVADRERRRARQAAQLG